MWVQDMAQELYLAPTTIKTHLRRLYEKLGSPTGARPWRRRCARSCRSDRLPLSPACLPLT
ncbi:hypothetical protein [Streptomyces sp. NPDC059389]|uniref:hypothetical protein n=1 Tax=Streptomyces sp. NPDC059389 TaxID=3346818 RepID=UPI0036B70F7C